MLEIDLIAALVELGYDSRAQVGSKETHAIYTELDEENTIVSQHTFVFATDPAME